MKRLCIAVVLVAALLLVGAAGAVKPEKGPVDKIVLVHYKDAPAKPSTGGDQSTAFKLMGVRWAQFPVTYYVNTANSGLGTTAVTTELKAAFSEWDDHWSKQLFSPGGSAVPAAADGKNDIYFAPLDSSNAIAMTTVWYYTATKEIAEADIQMNTRMSWGIDPDGEGPRIIFPKNSYDIRNIATHEVGHVCGLADLYGFRDTGLTMYGYGGIGEVKKDSLAPGDIAGLQKLYGA
jgi:hypothetical protein